ncbi:MAG: hypothetical protein ACTSRA_02800, partial [Promethearchaeota archaeon]
DVLVGGDRAHFKFPASVKILVNDKRVNVKFDFEHKYLDSYWIVTDISKYLLEGRNTIKMTCTTRNHETFHVVTDPWRLIGNFEVMDDDGIPRLKKIRNEIQLGDITQQGFPRFHGAFSYIKRIRIPEHHSNKRIVLEIENTKDCVEVKVNKKLVGILWHRWELDITNAIKTGEDNEIELVYRGIAQNMLQTNIKPQGLTGPIIIKIFENN